MNSILNTAIIRSPLLGQDKGVLFDDVEHVVGANNTTINTANPIKSIRVIYGEVIDGIAVEYRKTDKTTITSQHGTERDGQGRLDTGLTEARIDLTDTQVIIAVTGMQGESQHSGRLGGRRVARLSFVVFDTANGKVETKGPYGTQAATPFHVTADGIIVAFGGYAIDQEQSIAHNPEGGLFGLTIYEVAYRTI
ncbi:hypothetical protein K438DRAFT_1965426 [Mycena galopus ATCC 62051]|nr:hypothetical protein K438DRAFT_1965426 [Mycena galopus ATCC 62051]